VIAEAGSNHNGSLDQARRLVAIAAEAGADAVKFQTFRAEAIYAKSTQGVEYLKRLGIDKSIYDIIAEMEMPPEWIPELARASAEAGIAFLSTPFDEHSADLLAPHVPAFKMASYELTHLPLIRHVAAIGKPMILSTGAAVVDEIDEAVAVVREMGVPFALMQCTARYPASPASMNLRTIPWLKARYAVPAGLSDHSLHAWHAPVAAVSLGANLIEKHFTISRDMPGPDHSFAIEPAELTALVQAVRGVEPMLGDGVKTLHPDEYELVNFRRSVFVTRNIRAGETVTSDAVAVLRRSGAEPSDMPPKDIARVIGRKAARDLEANTVLSWSDVK
jgi:N-acetylneuraminate synthase